MIGTFEIEKFKLPFIRKAFQCAGIPYTVEKGSGNRFLRIIAHAHKESYLEKAINVANTDARLAEGKHVG